MKKVGSMSDKLKVHLYGPKIQKLQPRNNLAQHGVGLFERNCSIVDGNLDLLKKRLKFPGVNYREKDPNGLRQEWNAYTYISRKVRGKGFKMGSQERGQDVFVRNEFSQHVQAMEKAIRINFLRVGSPLKRIFIVYCFLVENPYYSLHSYLIM